MKKTTKTRAPKRTKPTGNSERRKRSLLGTATTTAKAVAFENWLDDLKLNVEKVAAAGEPVGACLVTDPHSGTNSCVLVDAKTCKALRGTFLGGPCG